MCPCPLGLVLYIAQYHTIQWNFVRLKVINGNLPSGTLWKCIAPHLLHILGWGGGSSSRALDSDPKTQGSNPIRKTRTICESFFESKLLCWLAVGVPNPCVYTHAQEWSHTHVKDPVIHVGVWLITETRKDPACTKKWQNNQPVDCGHKKICKMQWIALYKIIYYYYY